jgi:hypothetical protein
MKDGAIVLIGVSQGGVGGDDGPAGSTPVLGRPPKSPSKKSLIWAMHDSRYPVTFVPDTAMGSVGWCPDRGMS